MFSKFFDPFMRQKLHLMGDSTALFPDLQATASRTISLFAVRRSSFDTGSDVADCRTADESGVWVKGCRNPVKEIPKG